VEKGILIMQIDTTKFTLTPTHSFVLCCSVLQCVAVCCNSAPFHANTHSLTSVRANSFAETTTLSVGDNILQHTAIHYNALHHTSTNCNSTTPCCSTLHHTTTHCYTLRHTHCRTHSHAHTWAASLRWPPTHRKTGKNTAQLRGLASLPLLIRCDTSAIHCNTLHHTATHCNKLVSSTTDQV